MGVNTRTIIYTLYTIICDCCGKSTIVDTGDDRFIYNRRQAVRRIGWHFGRDGFIKCPSCHRCCRYKK